MARFDAQLDTGLDQERVMYYDQSWRLLEERIDDDFDAEPGDGADRALQYVWGNRYIDDIAFRRSNDNFSNDDPDVTYNSEWYYATDALFSAVAIFRGRGALTERVQYDAYGAARHQRSGDVDGDGDTDGADNAAHLTVFNATIDQTTYNVDADINRDGVINGTDGTLLNNNFGAALPKGQLSNTDNIIGFDGYVFNAPDEVYTVRNRSYDFHQGRWVERDPAKYLDGSNLYAFNRNSPPVYTDPAGLACTIGLECQLIGETPHDSGLTSTCHFLCQEVERTYSHGGCVLCDDVPANYTKLQDTTAILADCRDSFKDTVIILDPEADQPECSRSACRAGCDLISAAAVEACGFLGSEIQQQVCEATAEVARLTCHGACNIWCNNP